MSATSKNKPSQKKASARPPGPPRQASPARKGIPVWAWGLIIGVVTVLAFWPNCMNQLTTWDDDVYIYDNKEIKGDLTWQAINKFVAGNWQPGLVTQMWAEYHLFGLKKAEHTIEHTASASLDAKMDPEYEGNWYHSVNLLMHLLNALFLFLFLRELGRTFFSRKDNEPIALLAAMIFCIHPMHVESVCWASETKDVGYAMWYHAALWVFCLYLGQKQIKYLVATGFLFALSLLYKGQAVILPAALVLIAMVHIQARREDKSFDWQAAIPGWLRSLKIQDVAFFIIAFALSFLVSRMAFAAQAHFNFLEHKDIKSIPAFERLVCIFYGMGNYILKVIAPFGLCMFHSYPKLTNGLFAWYVYAIALLPFVLLVLLWLFRRNLLVVFAILFFLVHILPVSQFVAVGASIYWDRFSYISYDGFCLLAAWVAVHYYPVYKVPVAAIVAGFLLFFVFSTHARTEVWHDSKSLYQDGLSENPDNTLINGCLGMVYYSEGNIPEATKYLDRSIAISDETPGVLATRAHIYVGSIRPDMPLTTRLALLDSAITDCDLSILNNHDSANSYGGLGICYSMKGEMTGQKVLFDSARIYLQDALKFHGPDTADICLNIGHSFNNAGRYDSALVWYGRALSADTTLWPAYIHSAMILYQMGKPYWAKAATDFRMAEEHDPNPANRDLAKNYLQAISSGN